jgi:KDO2-lipid IV(A) lauroyltransferase
MDHFSLAERKTVPNNSAGKISFQTILNSRLGVGLALGIGRAIPRGAGYFLSTFIADWISSQSKLRLTQVARANQWVVNGERLPENELDLAVRSAFRYTARSLYDLYHTRQSPAAMQRLVHFNETAKELIERSRAGKDGAVVVGLHLSNFDLVMQAAGLRGFKAQVLSVSQPSDGYRMQNDLRSKTGLQMTPASMPALREALNRLQAGGTVLTGADRPIPDPKYLPKFFGRPAPLPVHHVYLALKAKVPVYVFASIMQPDGLYHVVASRPILMQPHTDRHQEIIQNAEAVLKAVEDFIRQAPQQWSMFFPVWPEVFQEMTEKQG